jgi:hypothetical protein
MPKDQVLSKFGLQTYSKGAQNMLGAVMNKLGASFDKNSHLSSIASGKKSNP